MFNRSYNFSNMRLVLLPHSSIVRDLNPEYIDDFSIFIYIRNKF